MNLKLAILFCLTILSAVAIICLARIYMKRIEMQHREENPSLYF